MSWPIVRRALARHGPRLVAAALAAMLGAAIDEGLLDREVGEAIVQVVEAAKPGS